MAQSNISTVHDLYGPVKYEYNICMAQSNTNTVQDLYGPVKLPASGQVVGGEQGVEHGGAL